MMYGEYQCTCFPVCNHQTLIISPLLGLTRGRHCNYLMSSPLRSNTSSKTVFLLSARMISTRIMRHHLSSRQCYSEGNYLKRFPQFRIYQYKQFLDDPTKRSPPTDLMPHPGHFFVLVLVLLVLLLLVLLCSPCPPPPIRLCCIIEYLE